MGIWVGIASMQRELEREFPLVPVMLPLLAGLRFVRKIGVESCLHSTAIFSTKHSRWPDGR